MMIERLGNAAGEHEIKLTVNKLIEKVEELITAHTGRLINVERRLDAHEKHCHKSSLGGVIGSPILPEVSESEEETCNGEVIKLEAEISTLKVDKSALLYEADIYRDSLGALKAEVERLKGAVSDKDELIAEIARLQEQLADEEDKPDLSMALEAACENCDSLRAEIARKESAVLYANDRYVKEIRAYVESTTKLKALIATLNDKLADLTDNYESLGKLCDELEAENDVLKDEQASPESGEPTMETCETCAEIIELRTENAILKSDLADAEYRYETVSKALDMTIEERDEAYDERERLKAENAELSEAIVTYKESVLQNRNVVSRVYEENTKLKAENVKQKRTIHNANSDLIKAQDMCEELKAENERLKMLENDDQLHAVEADLAKAQEKIERYEEMERRAQRMLMLYVKPTATGMQKAIASGLNCILSALDSD